MATRYDLSAVSTYEHPSVAWGSGWANTGHAGLALRTQHIDTGRYAANQYHPNGNTNRGYIQWSSRLLAAGQTVYGTWKCQSVWGTVEPGSVYAAVAARIIGSDGTIRRTLTAVVRHGTAMTVGNYGFSGYLASDYVTVTGDRLVLELGWGGSANTRNKDLYYGYTSAGWLAETTFEAGNPNLSAWFELTDVTLTHLDPVVTAAAGAFTLGSQPTGFLGPKKLAGDPGTFGLSGKDISLARTRALAVDPLPYVLSGQDAVFASGQAMTADAGSFAVLGQDADFQKTRLITSDPGSFVVGGKSAGLTRGDTSALDAAEFTVSGQDAAFVFAPGTTFGAGVFAVSGQDAMLTYSSAPPSTSIGTGGDTLAWLLIDKPGGNW